MTLGVSFILALGFLLMFLWASKGGQYEDSETPAIRMLLDETVPDSHETEINKTEINKTESITKSITNGVTKI